MTSPKRKGMKTSAAVVNLSGNQGTGSSTPLDILNNNLSLLKENKRQFREKNIKKLADGIASNPEADKIIESIVNYLKRDLNKVKVQEIKFLLRLLRKYIERQNSNNPKDEPVYNWKDVKNIDLRRINKIQNQLEKLGLTKIIYTSFELSDIKITKETLLLSLAYTYGGNRAIQAEFFERFIEDDENKIISGFGKSLSECWTHFRAKEGERMEQLTIGSSEELSLSSLREMSRKL